MDIKEREREREKWFQNLEVFKDAIWNNQNQVFTDSIMASKWQFADSITFISLISKDSLAKFLIITLKLLIRVSC